MLFHLVLYNLAIALLDPLEVGLRLCKLIFPIEDQGLGALYFLFYVPHHLGYYVDLV